MLSFSFSVDWVQTKQAAKAAIVTLRVI